MNNELLKHPPHSSDFAHSDLHPFTNLNEFLAGEPFGWKEETLTAKERYFANLSNTFNGEIYDKVQWGLYEKTNAFIN